MLRTPGMSCPFARDAPRARARRLSCSFRNRPVPVMVPQVPRPDDEVRHAFRRVWLPDLRPGRLVVRLGIGLVDVLVEHVEIGSLPDLHGLGDGSLRCARRRTQGIGQLHHVGSEETQHRALLQRHLARQRRRQRVAPGVGDHRQRHAGVARGRLHQLLLLVHRAPRLAVGDQVRRDAVLDRPERVVPLQLAVDLRMPERRHPVQADQRGRIVGVGEQTENRVVDTQPVVIHSLLILPDPWARSRHGEGPAGTRRGSPGQPPARLFRRCPGPARRRGCAAARPQSRQCATHRVGVW